jgi:hypothetical protein
MLEAIDRSAGPNPVSNAERWVGLLGGRKLQLLMTSTNMLVIIATNDL